MAFFGASFTGCSLSHLIGENGQELVHCSSVFVKPGPKDKSAYWDLEMSGKDGAFLSVCRLTRTSPSQQLDLYLSDDSVVRVVGEKSAGSEETKFDLTGFYEPFERLGEDDESESDEEALNESDESDEEEKEEESGDDRVSDAISAAVKKVLPSSTNTTEVESSESEKDSSCLFPLLYELLRAGALLCSAEDTLRCV